MSAVVEAAQAVPSLSHYATAALGTGVGAGGVGGVWGLWTWLSERSKARASAPAAMTQSLAAFQATLNDQARALIGSFRDEVAEMRQRIEALETENETCRRENRRAVGRIEVLEATLRRAGVEIPAIEAAPVA
jgi:hypothetical protein